MKTRMAGLAVLFLATGCKSFQAPFGRLESAVVNDRYASAPPRTAVRIIRSDSVVAPVLSMRLAVGDSIITSRDTRVVLTFAAGYEVTLDTSTVLYIAGPTGGQARLDEAGSGAGALELRSWSAPPVAGTMRTVGTTPGIKAGGLRLSMPADTGDASLFVRIGRAFIRHILGKPDTLDTRTPQATLHEEGTEYVVSVDGNGTSLRVITGAVRAEGRGGQWSVRYREREGGLLQAGAPPRQMRTLQPDEVNTELNWVRQVERLTKVPVPSLNGLTESQARASVSRAGLRVSAFVLRREDDAPVGTVLDQTPAAGELTRPDGDVVLTVSKGKKRANPDSARVESARQCTVPAITGKRQVEAMRLLTAAGLKGAGTRNSNAVDDIVQTQSVGAQRQVNCDAVVTFTYGTIVR